MTSEPLPLGTEVKPYGKIEMIGSLDGERYYWLVNKDGSVAMMPSIVIEGVAKSQGVCEDKG